MAKIKVAIFGAAGYAGEELLRILLRHRQAEIVAITSRKNAGKPVSEVFPRYTNSGLTFCEPDVEKIAAECDAAILALPHGLASEFALPLLAKGVKVLDISADFRLRSYDKYKEYYGEHPAPELLKKAVYGLPERYRAQIKTADLIACPGCYPTSSILPSAPLLAAKLVTPEGVVVSSCSGVTGAGRKVDLPYLFPECNESVKAYKVYGHRHLPEIEQEMAVAAGVPAMAINFIPHLVPVSRGINSTLILNAAPGCTMEKIGEAYLAAYGNEQFVRILPPGRTSDTKYVTMTNCCEIGYNLDPHTNKVIVTSCIDNLTKGASGQAVQCLNIRFGLDEAEGLIYQKEPVMTVFNFGSLNIDHVYNVPHFVRPGETLAAGDYTQHGGGKGANQSVALGRAGANVHHVGKIGADGKFLADLLSEAGVDITGLQIDPATHTGHAIIEIDAAGENRILLYGGANQELTSQQLQHAAEQINSGDFVLLQNETNNLALILQLARQKHAKIFFNPAPMGPEVLALPLDLVDFFIVNETEGATLAQVELTARPDKILEALQQKYPHAEWVLTLGAQGALYAGTAVKGILQVPAAPAAKIVDTTGAGDTFIGYLLAALAADRPLPQALAIAARAAAIGIGRAGAIPSIPTAAEVGF